MKSHISEPEGNLSSISMKFSYSVGHCENARVLDRLWRAVALSSASSPSCVVCPTVDLTLADT